jgi:ATP-binding cassette subfamily F protein 3
VEIEDGMAVDYPGDYEYYLWKRARELEAETGDGVMDERQNGHQSARSPGSSQVTQGPDRRELVKSLGREERRMADMEGAIAELEGRIRWRDQELEREELYQDHERWHALHLERQQWDKDLERLMEEWARQTEAVVELRQQVSAMTPRDMPQQLS